MKAIIYVRVSSKQQNNIADGHKSLSVQLKQCLTYAKQCGYAIVKAYRDIGSASKNKQRELMKAIASHQNVTLIVFNISRFSRNIESAMANHKAMMKKNIKLVSLTEPCNFETAEGQHQLRVLVSSSQLETDRISQRIKASNEYIKSLGGYLGNVAPYGYKLVHESIQCSDTKDEIKIRKLAIDEHEQLVLKFIYFAKKGDIDSSVLTTHLYNALPAGTKQWPIWIWEGEYVVDYLKSNGLTYADVAHLLNEYGLSNRGKPWTTYTVTKAFKSYVEKIKDNVSDDDFDTLFGVVNGIKNIVV